MPYNSTKSFVKSSRSSLHSHTSSISSAARSSAKAIGQGIKCIKKGANAIVQPFKWAKLPEVIAVGSGEELDDLEKELVLP
jgi:hypothetical protein